ncbi:E3 ubiquitin-protein ligase TRIM31-like [Ochotona curzoniae]|uniref:E3 ubiquitin-protein ligase TRIM31-like n=1 Tax=Ochotona curzoniae TaxID=130825 RepID=UPI001B3539C5|nr:E3 ubiquitin-protein ligase TRIM31-like [Ochotona curzoniae]
MASQSFPTNLQQEVTCNICLEILQDPVTIYCGHSFCHSCITQLKLASKDFFKCPLCKMCMDKDTFPTNWLLWNLVEKIQAMYPSERRLEKEKLRCSKHGEKQNYYCKSDGELLCVICEDSKEHRFHNTSLIEKAVKHYQEQIQRHVGVLEQKEQVLVHVKAQGEEKISNLMGAELSAIVHAYNDRVMIVHEELHYFNTIGEISVCEERLVEGAQVEFEKQRIQTEFEHLQQVLEEEKNSILSNIKELANNGAKESERYSAATKVQLSSLKDFKDSLKDKQRMPPIELLEDIKGTLHRSEGFQSQFHIVSSIPMDLERKISKAKSRHDSIIKSLRKFGEKLQAEKKKHRSKILSEMSVSLWQNTPVTLDVASAHPGLNISQDLKMVTADVIAQNSSEDEVKRQHF